MGVIFTYKRRIQFYETDPQGFLHHSNYFRIFEETRGEFLRSVGIPYSKLRERGYEVVLIRASCEFKRPVLYDEVVEVVMEVLRVGRVRFELFYKVLRDGEVKALGKTEHCFLRGGKVSPIPEEVLRALTLQGPDRL